MSGEDQAVDTTALPKFDMPLYESEMTAKDVKSLSIQYAIPLDLHPVALTKGWTMDKLPDNMIGLYEQYFEFSGIRRVGKGVGGQVFQETFSGLKLWKTRFFFLDRRAIPNAIAWRHHDSDVNDPVPEDGFSASDVQTLTERVVDLRHDQIRKGKEKGKVVMGREGSRHATKIKKTVARKDGPAISGATSSPEPLRTINPTDPFGTVAETAESQEDRSPYVSPHGSSSRSVHNYSNTHVNEETDTLRLGTFGDKSGRAMMNVNTKVVQSSPMHRPAHHSPITTRSASPLRSIQRVNVEAGESSSRGFLYARLDLAHSSHLYTTLSDRYKAIKNKHEGCAGQLEVLEGCNSELSLREKLVTQLSKTKMEKFDCMCKLLPIVVERLLQSHEYKQSMFEPLNMAIQAGWGKGLREERSKEDLLELTSMMENLKISHGFRHPVSDLLKAYPDSPPSGQAPPSQPSSRKAASTSAPRAS
nr:hypothetical protein [Tanacetum cinerariifolium]